MAGYDPYDPNQNQMGDTGDGTGPTGPESPYLSTDPYAGQGAGTPGAPGTFSNQSTATDPTAAAWKIGMAVPPGYETFHPNGDPAKLGIRRAQGATAGPPPPSSPIKIGDQTTFNDQLYTWNGKTWEAATQGATTKGATTGAAGPYGGDPTNVDTWLQWLATQPGHDPILDTPNGIAYYKQRIGETGGLSASNAAYWQNKATLAANGGAVGAPEGGGTGSLWNHMPTLADIQGIPGYQEALAEGKRSYETGAASKGTILNGRTIAGEGAAVSNQVLSQFYFPYAQQNYLNNQGNANNLYNLANLGLNGSSVGAA